MNAFLLALQLLTLMVFGSLLFTSFLTTYIINQVVTARNGDYAEKFIIFKEHSSNLESFFKLFNYLIVLLIVIISVFYHFEVIKNYNDFNFIKIFAIVLFLATNWFCYRTFKNNILEETDSSLVTKDESYRTTIGIFFVWALVEVFYIIIAFNLYS